MRSVLIVGVLALLILDYVHTAPQNISRILRNSTFDENESETSGFESEKTEEIASTEDDTESSTMEGRNAETTAGENSSLSSDYDYNDSNPSEKHSEIRTSNIPSETSSSSSLPTEQDENINDASDQSTPGMGSFLTTTFSKESSARFTPENKREETDLSSVSHIRNNNKGSDKEAIMVEDRADLPNKPESSDISSTDQKITKSEGNDDHDNDKEEKEFKISDDDSDYGDSEIRRSDELIEGQGGEHDEHSSTSSALSDTSSLPQQTSGTLDKLVINSELNEDFREVSDDIKPSADNSRTEDDGRIVPPNTTNLESLKFQNEELTSIPGEIEKLTTTVRTTEPVVTDRSEELTDIFTSSADGLHIDEDHLERGSSRIPATTSESTEKPVASISFNPHDSKLLETKSAITSSSPSVGVTNGETTNQQVSSEIPKISKTSEDTVSVKTIATDQSTVSPLSISLFEDNTAPSINSSSKTLVSDDFTGGPEERTDPTSKLTSESAQTVSADSTESTLFTDKEQPVSGNLEASAEINDEDHFSTVADTLSSSNTDLDSHYPETIFPTVEDTSSAPTFETTSSAPTFETTEGDERSLELKVPDSSAYNSDKLDINTAPEDRMTTFNLPTTTSKEPTTTTKERTTIWHGPTVLPRQTTTSSEISTKLMVETEPVPSKDEELQMQQGDAKDFLETRFSDRYLSGDNTDMIAAVQFLHYHDKASSEQCFKLVDAHWNYATNLTEENKRKQLQQTLEYSLFHKEAWKNATSFAWKSFNDTLIRRWFKSLSILGNAALPEDKLTEFNQLKAEMKNSYSTAKVCPYRKPEERNSSKPERCNLSLEPDLQSILMKSRDYDELVHVWKAWRDAAGKPIREKFLRFVELSNEAATLNGFPDTGDMWREAYESDTFQQELDLLWEQLRPLYEHLHAYVRRKLINQYGSDKIREDGPIPAHLFGNMWAQSWVSLLDITQPFPGKPSVDVTPTMVTKNMTALDMFKVSEEFFTSLGLKAMPDEFWKYSLIEKPKDREIICHASAWDFCNGRDYRIKQCTVITMEDLITVHHEMGHIQYFMQYARQPNVFREGANPGFHEAIGDVLALSVSTPSHLLSIGLLDEIADDPEGDLNFLLRTALEKVSFLPSGYLIDLWRWGLFSGEIKYEEMNRRWWELRLKYQGICPPVKRTDEDFDPGAKYHVAGNVPYIRYFVSFVIQFQFHKVLCDAAGHTGPLYKCDIYRSKEAGQILSQVMELGSSEHWSEAMRIMTGGAQTKMDAQPIMEYFEPLLKWLIDQNKNEILGWGSNDATICP